VRALGAARAAGGGERRDHLLPERPRVGRITRLTSRLWRQTACRERNQTRTSYARSDQS
jgi:hypothetical protein